MVVSLLPEPPPQLKAIHSYIKVATDVERVDPVVSYWVRLYATEAGFKIDKDSPQSKTFLAALISWLEQFKKAHSDNEAITNPTVGQAHYENFVIALFNKADTMDREGVANKNTIRMFFMAAVLFEAMAAFGAPTDYISEKAKYAKFKAAYIQRCIKTGLTPKPGPLEEADFQDPAHKELKIPEVPTDQNTNTTKQDSFILTPSSTSGYQPGARPMPMQPPSPDNRLSTGYSSGETPTVEVGSTPSQRPSTIGATKFHATNGAPLNPEDIITGQKYCKFANSALQYDDIPTAVANLQKALKLLTTGEKTN